jgi:peptide/nickel transport system substrate-binding protein
MSKKIITRRQFIRLGGTAALGATLAACSPALVPTATPPPAPPATSAPPAATSVPPTKAPIIPTLAPAPTALPIVPTAGTGTLTVGFPFGPNNLDPYFWSNFREEDMVTAIFDPLIYREPDGPFVSHLAESWKRIDDYTWQFKLKQGVTFQNGKPFNAAAVKFSLERAIDPNLKPLFNSPKLIKLKGGQVVDEFTVNMITETPLAETYMYQRFFDFAMLEPSYYQGLSPDAAATKPMGTGPFKFVEWVKDDHLTLEAVPNYWRSDHHWKGLPNYKTLIYKIIPDVSSRIAALQTGLIDIAFDIPLDQVKNMTGDMRPALGTSDTRLFIGMNQRNPYLKDTRVRQALNYAINWDPINQALYYGKVPRMTSWVAPQSVNFNKDLKPYTYDPSKAQALLKAAGVPDKVTLSLIVDNAVAERPLVAQAIAADLAKVGITVNIAVTDLTSLRKKLTAKEVEDLWLHAYGGGSDDGQGALTSLQKDYVFSAYSWDNPQWEKLFADLNGVAAIDIDKRRTTMLQLQQIAVDDPPVVYLAIEPNAYGVGKRVKSWQPRFDKVFMPWEVTLA